MVLTAIKHPDFFAKGTFRASGLALFVWLSTVFFVQAQPTSHIELLPIYYQGSEPILLEKVAEKYGVSTHQLKSWNRMTGEGMLPANTRIVAAFTVQNRKRAKPVKTSERTIFTDFGSFDRIYHQVSSKEYLLDIADAYDANIHQVQEWNGFRYRDINVIVPGQNILVGFEFMDDRTPIALEEVKAEASTEEETPVEPLVEQHIPLWVWILIGLLGLTVAALIVLLVLKRKNDKEEDNEEEGEEEDEYEEEDSEYEEEDEDTY